MTNQEFIKQIAPIFVKYAKKYGYKIASAAIAQACLESGYGTSYKAIHGNNLLGLKYRPNRITTNNGYFENGGSEQSPNGVYTQLPSNTAWYSFPSYDACIEGYYQFISIAKYAQVKQANNPLNYLQAIKTAGYATSINYVQNVYNVVQKWNLTQYDTGLQDITSSSVQTSALSIIQKTNTHNTTKCNSRKIEWIVLHYTAGTTSTRGSAQNTAAYFSTTTNQASADFIVDDETIVQYNPDPLNYYCWAVGGNKYSNKTTSQSGQYYGQCKNANSISIEMCSNKTNKASLAATDDDWYITEKTQKMAEQLTTYLLQLYNIDKSHVIMHHQVTGKACPQPWCKNEQALNNWNKFLNNINAGTQIPVSVQSSISAQDVISGGESVKYVVRITANTLNVRSGPGTIYSINRTVNKGSAYTIVEEQDGWGRLISGAGWICLDYTEKVDSTSTAPTQKELSYLVRVTADTLNVRSGPGTNYPIVLQVKRGSAYTIVEEDGDWGLLKSYQKDKNGYINLKYTEKV
jgi:N-acetylmuramoyl-L-alanine amidase CwlA